MFKKEFFSMCKELLTPLGFKRKGNGLYRIVNDVVQSIYLECLGRNYYGRGYRVVFNANHFCTGPRLNNALYELKKFKPWTGPFLFDRWFCQDSPEEIVSCVKEIKYYIEKYLIPFFNNTFDAASVLSEKIKVENTFIEKWKEGFILDGDEVPEYNQEGISFPEEKYCLAIKACDFEYAQYALEWILKVDISAYEDSLTNTMYPPGYSERLKISIAENEKELELIKNKNYEYFKDYFTETEEKTRDFFRAQKFIFFVTAEDGSIQEK